ncbi:MAG: thiamine pyrophosphate-binding protein [Deltaproteobacteria bacterium]|nr:thiamine pyrophosphate-binding protein [Deltaproteobacteria bacterium]
MQTTRYITQALRTEGLDHVFLVPGGLIDPFLAALSETDGLTPMVAAHEAGAAFMADGYARASGRFGACFGIGGPGVTNMITAMAAARTDSSPILLVTGQVPTDWEGRGGFQDSSPAALNDVAMLEPVCVRSMAVESVHLVHHHLRACLTRMLAPLQGPVHMSVPLDIQKGEVHIPWTPLPECLRRPRFLDLHGLDLLRGILSPDQGPPPVNIVILAGAGVDKSGAHADLIRLAEAYAIPVATTLRAKGVFPEDHPLSLGVFGYAGHRPAIEAILSGEVDVLLVLGSGLGQRDTMYWSRRMLPKIALAHVDSDPTAIGRTWPTEAPVIGDCGEALRALLAEPDRLRALTQTAPKRKAWTEAVLAVGPRTYGPENIDSRAVPIHPARVVAELRRAMPRDGALVVDSGAHRAFCGHYWESYGPGTYFSATNVGPMGWAVPAAVGVKAARPDRPVAVVTGDGCMLMHGMEIQTAARYGLAVVFVVINNSALGNVWFRAREQGPGPAGLTEIPNHDWVRLARALGLEARRVDRPEQLAPTFEAALASGRPFLVDCLCDKAFETPVTPFAQAKMEWVDED